MAFTVEDGSGVSGANSYVSVADADAYFADIGAPADWSGATTTEKEQALVKGTQYLEAHYRWSSGSIGSDDQGLGWPRSGAEDRYGRSIDDDVVPEAVKQATCEAAVRTFTADLAGDQTQKVLSEEVSGAVAVTYDANSPQHTRYPLIDQLLTGLASSGSLEVEIVRS